MQNLTGRILSDLIGRRHSVLRNALAAILIPAMPCAAQAQPSVTIVPGLVRIEQVTWVPAAPDLSNAAGSGTLVVGAGPCRASRPGVTFSGLVLGDDGRVRAGVVPLGGVESTLLGASLNLAEIRVTVPAPGAGASAATPSIRAGGTLDLPVRGADGQRVRLLLDEIIASADSVEFRKLAWQGAGDIVLPGIRLRRPTGDPRPTLRLQLDGNGVPDGWTLSFPSVLADIGLPGVTSEPAWPISCTITDLILDSDGLITFGRAQVSGQEWRPFGVGGSGGFSVELTGFEFEMQSSVIRVHSATANVTLPKPTGTSATVLTGVTITAGGQGILFDVSDARAAISGTMDVRIERGVLDLSVTASTGRAGAPSHVRAATWTGLWIEHGALVVRGLAGGSGQIEVVTTGLVIEPDGVSGVVSAAIPTAGPTGVLPVAGFPITSPFLEATFDRGRMLRGVVSGVLRIGPGNHPVVQGACRIEFDESGVRTGTVTSGQLRLTEFGAEITGFHGRVVVPTDGPVTLLVSGDLKFDSLPVGTPAVSGLTSLSFGVVDLGVTSDGSFLLPPEGRIELSGPVAVPLGIGVAEINGVRCELAHGRMTEMTFSGGLSLGESFDFLPLTGAVRFEGFSIRPGPPVTFALRGIGIAAELPRVCSLKASLSSAMLDDSGFAGTVLAGGAELTLTCLGSGVNLSGSAGARFTMLVAPEDQAWFIGGAVTLPAPYCVTVPAPSGAVPVVTLFGFQGGFGWNVRQRSGANYKGPITSPATQLVKGHGPLMQAGLLMGDPAPGPAAGAVWWGDLTLTLTLSPFTVDLTGRAVLLDPLSTKTFLSPEEFRKKDRWALVYATLDAAVPRFEIGAAADMCFPTRDFSVVRARGEGVMRLDAQGLYAAFGHGGTQSLRVDFIEALNEWLSISGEVSFVTEYRPSGQGSGDSWTGNMAARLALTARLKNVPGVDARLQVSGSVRMTDFTGRMRAEGVLSLSGTARVGAFLAEVDGRVRATLDSRSEGMPQFRIRDAWIAGRFNGFEATIELPEITIAA